LRNSNLLCAAKVVTLDFDQLAEQVE